MTREDQKSDILRCATKKPLTGAELNERLNAKYPDRGYRDGRSYGRALGELVTEGKILKTGPKSKPTYARAA